MQLTKILRAFEEKKGTTKVFGNLNLVGINVIH